MKFSDNLQELLTLPVDYVGFIFYEKSPRYAGHSDFSNVDFPDAVQRVGVFVDAPLEMISSMIRKYILHAVQLHGNESPDICGYIKSEHGVELLKSFNIKEKEDVIKCKPYASSCDYFLFDTQTSMYGGSGKQFDWSILNDYEGRTPFFLSGGISPEDVGKIKAFSHPSFYGIDLNSRFEISPGQKDLNLLSPFLYQLKINL